MAASGSHNHYFRGGERPNGNTQTTRWENTSDYNRISGWLQDNYTGYSGSHTHTINNTGGNKPHENRMPYIVVNRWKRTA